VSRYTIFTTPVLKKFLRIIALILLKTLRWKAVGPLPEQKKYIIIVAPHTSNWDVFYGFILAFTLKLDARFLAKKELFRWPFAPIIRWIGGIATDRSSHDNIVDKIVKIFNENEKFVLAIAPEGTRHKVDHWKSGFYHIAKEASIPIVLAFIDYGTKTGGVGPLLYPSGDINKDMIIIRDFYLNKKGKKKDQTSPAAIHT
jgi:1-acyl-sn-glycerol-3-phosphate acyltransferase